MGGARAAIRPADLANSASTWLRGQPRRRLAFLRGLDVKGPSRQVARVLLRACLETLTPVVAVFLAPLFYWRVLTPNPNDVATFPPGDFTDLNFPYRKWVAEELARGMNPWWNPYVSAGHSAIGDIQFRIFYPLDTWLARYLGGGFDVRALEIDVIGHVALAVFFTYLLARRLTGSRTGGMVAAIVFGFGGYLSGFPVQQVNLLDASVWLPLILLCIDVGADFNLVTGFVIGAGALGLSALAGHPQTLFYVCLASGLYLLFKGWNQGRIRWAALPGLPILFLGGGGVAATALVPAYFHLGLTDRTDVSYAFSSTGFALHEALGLVLPVQFGGTPLYCGIFTLLLVAVALGARRARANKLFWLGLAILSLVLSFGGGTFLQSGAYLLLGSFKFRQYERIVFLLSLSIAILAGYGASELTRGHDLRVGWLRRALAWALAALGVFSLLCVVQSVSATGDAQVRLIDLVDRAVFTAVILGLGAAIVLTRERRALGPGLAGVMAVGLVCLDLFSTNWQGNLRPGTPEDLLAPSPIVDYLQNYTVGLYRIASEGLLPGDGNAGSLFRLQDVVGNSPLETRDYADFTQQVPEATRWQVLNVRYVITKRKIDDPRLQLLRQDGDKNLYELAPKQLLPRAYIVHQTVIAPDHQLALDLMKSVDPRTTAVIEWKGPDLGSNQPDQSKVHVTEDQADEVAISAELPSPGLLVVSEVDYPGWHAFVDGRVAPIYRADGIIRAVYLTAGLHQVRFAFVPLGLADGEQASALVWRVLVDLVIVDLVAHLGWIGFSVARRRVRRPSRRT
ncbi:MAG: YfhO family protein [Chloroflexota bacterium]